MTTEAADGDCDGGNGVSEDGGDGDGVEINAV